MIFVAKMLACQVAFPPYIKRNSFVAIHAYSSQMQRRGKNLLKRLLFTSTLPYWRLDSAVELHSNVRKAVRHYHGFLDYNVHFHTFLAGDQFLGNHSNFPRQNFHFFFSETNRRECSEEGESGKWCEGWLSENGGEEIWTGKATRQAAN